MSETGLRIGEAVAARWCDVELDRGVLTPVLFTEWDNARPCECLASRVQACGSRSRCSLGKSAYPSAYLRFTTIPWWLECQAGADDAQAPLTCIYTRDIRASDAR